MPTPTIPDGELFMNATLYTGTGAAQSITNGAAGQSFQPDLVWVKSRSNTNFNTLMDSVRGTNKLVYSNSTAAEETNAQIFTALNSNGFSVGTDNSANQSGQTFVAWQWKAGGTAVTNTAGSITSQVSANTTSGFSIVTYTGTGANATVGHGLGVAPKMIIVKRRDSGPSSWTVWHSTFSSIEYIYLNLTNAVSSSSGSTVWNSTVPSSSVFSLGTYSDVNASGGTHVAYCWTPIAGYSAIGSYTGNGSADGPFVYLGFRPRFVLVKRTDSTSTWGLIDTARDTYNVTTKLLFANTPDAENTSYTPEDILSNGFKLRDTTYNISSGTYIYMAFCENPFKFANAR
jgi:hypothetical protein